MKKLTMLAALLAILLTAATPLVLAQQVPEPPPAPAQQPAPAPPPGPTPAPSGFVVGCQILFNDPNAMCDVDEDGSITLPDGTKAPVVVEPDGTAYIVNDETVTVIGQGPSVMPDEEPPGGGQYDNAPGGGPQGPPPPPPGTP